MQCYRLRGVRPSPTLILVSDVGLLSPAPPLMKLNYSKSMDDYPTRFMLMNGACSRCALRRRLLWRNAASPQHGEVVCTVLGCEPVHDDAWLYR